MSEKLDKNKSSKIKVKSGSQPAPKLQGRDTVYIDIDDDITSIIESVKGSDSSVVALVPPKRIGALQSVVNLKLLQKAASGSRKKISLITADSALVALAAGLRIPVAKNLNEQAVLKDAPDIEDDSDDDVIDGNEIAIGEISKLADKKSIKSDQPEDKEISAAVAAIETDDKIKNDLDADGRNDDEPKAVEKKAKAKRIPNFNSFRKKLLIFGSLGVFLIAFLVWAIWFAPTGTITIIAKTSSKNIENTITLDSSNPTNIEESVLHPTVKQTKKTETVNFTATGSKEVGDKASGTIKLTRTSISSTPISIPAGTRFTSSKLTFVSIESATLSGSGVGPGGLIQDTATVKVEAIAIGDEYNISSASYQLSVSGVSAHGSNMTGGSKKTVKAVQQSDINTATEQLKESVDEDQLKSELTKQIDSGYTVLQDSFSVNYGSVASNPGLGEAAEDGKATATMEITYTLVGVSDDDVKSYLDAQAKADLEDDQKVYDNGQTKVQFKNFAASRNGYSVIIKASAQVGPTIDEAKIKSNAAGKKSGEIMSEIERIDGVSSVKVRFSPFWVNSAPSADKLKVEFTVDE